MESADRIRAIMNALRTSDSVSAAELALAYGVSEMTIRRDLDELAQQGWCGASAAAP